MPKPTFYNLDPEKRKRIIDAAIDEFATLPFAAASINRIVKGAGIAKGSFYQYFDDLLDLYRFVVLEHGGAEKMAFIQAQGPPPEGGDLFDEFAWMGLLGLRWAMTRPRLAACARQLWGSSPQPGLEAFQDEVEKILHQQFRHVLERGQEQGVVRPDIDLDMAAALMQAEIRFGLDAVMKQRLGFTALDLVLRPELGRDIDEATLRAVMDFVIDVIRRAWGTGQGGGHIPVAEFPFQPGGRS